MASSRRVFCTTALMAAPMGFPAIRTFAQAAAAPIPVPPADIAAIQRPRIVAAAAALLTQPVLRFPPAPDYTRLARNHFYSEPLEFKPSSDAVLPALPFRAHAEALRETANTIATLTAAYLLTQELRYATQAGLHLRTLLVDDRTRLTAAFDHAGTQAPNTRPFPPELSPGLLDAAPLAEIARSLSLLTDAEALSPTDFEAARTWFRDFLTWLTTARPALFARDSKHRMASAWLLLAAATARLLHDEKSLVATRNLFRKPTIRNQIVATGIFPQEVATPNPYRDTLENFDLLAGACELLSTPYESLWQYELPDGPGLRAASAFLYPVIADPGRWPYPADAEHFRDLPGRRPALLFAARAYRRPEYLSLWRSLPETPASIANSFPITEPILWITKPLHGA